MEVCKAWVQWIRQSSCGFGWRSAGRGKTDKKDHNNKDEGGYVCWVPEGIGIEGAQIVDGVVWGEGRECVEVDNENKYIDEVSIGIDTWIFFTFMNHRLFIDSSSFLHPTILSGCIVVLCTCWTPPPTKMAISFELSHGWRCNRPTPIPSSSSHSTPITTIHS